MGAQPDQIRHDIEETRAELSGDVDRLTERTSPQQMMQRRRQAMMGTARRMRERVMGAAQDVTHDVQQRGAHAADKARTGPEGVTRRAEGNPMAAGVFAFGAGLLAASLLPKTQAEQQGAARLGDSAREMMEPVKGAMSESAQHVKEGARESVQEATQEVKETATEAAQTTGQQTSEQAQQVAGRARESGQTVAGTARSESGGDTRR